MIVKVKCESFDVCQCNFIYHVLNSLKGILLPDGVFILYINQVCEFLIKEHNRIGLGIIGDYVDVRKIFNNRYLTGVKDLLVGYDIV